MLAFTGLLLVVALIVALVKFKLQPVTVFSTLPILAALFIGFSFSDTMRMVAMGMLDVLPTAALFVGSITYFGIMGDVGLFDAPIGWLTRRLRSTALSVLVVSACIAFITSLDGSGTTTLLLTVPIMLPIAKALKMRPLPLAYVISMMIGVMNFLPWGGPIGRAATVVGVETTSLWLQILPVQLFGLAMVFGACFLISRQEEGLGHIDKNGDVASVAMPALTDEDQALRRPKLFWINFALTVAVFVMLIFGVEAYIPFLIGVGIALPLNYWKGGERAQTARIKAHASNVLLIVVTILSAGMLLGVLQGTGMVEQMAETIVNRFMPPILGRCLHIVMGILSMPLTIVFDVDTLHYGILPVVMSVGNNFGVSEVQSALAMALGHNIGVGLCMTSATTYFGLGMFGLDYGDAFKYSFLKAFLFATILIAFGAVIGVF